MNLFGTISAYIRLDFTSTSISQGRQQAQVCCRFCFRGRGRRKGGVQGRSDDGQGSHDPGPRGVKGARIEPGQGGVQKKLPVFCLWRARQDSRLLCLRRASFTLRVKTAWLRRTMLTSGSLRSPLGSTGFESCRSHKKNGQKAVFFIWRARQDSNLQPSA